MNAFDLIMLMEPSVIPVATKIHLATWNGKEDPLNEYLAGRFHEWQQWQARKNFERPYVVALIGLETKNKWLFAGVYKTAGYELRESSVYYQLHELTSCEEMSGRLIIHYERSARQSYLKADGCSERLLVSEILPERRRITEFSSYRAICLSKDELDIIAREAIESWRVALSSVAGVYVITDTKTGKLYVGSASGEGGIWNRWLAYSKTGHGDNAELKRLLKAEGNDRSRQFQFSVLEIADKHESREGIQQRESHWKTVLGTRDHGLNAN